MTDTLVVGAGISGLAHAHALGARAEVLVLEAAPRAGGLVRTVTRNGFRFEEGPEALPTGARITRELARSLGVAEHDAPAEAGKRYLEREGRLLEVPGSPEDLATSRVLSIGAKLRLMAEATCAPREALDGSIADFARHRFGQEALERVVEPLVALLHAGDPEQLSLRACFPDVAQWVEQHGSITAALRARATGKKEAAKKEKPRAFAAPGPGPGSGLWRPELGMQALVDALARALGERLRLGTSVRSIERAGKGWRVVEDSGTVHDAARVVLAVPLAAARALLADPAPAAAAALGSMQAESLVSVVHGYRRADVGHALDGSGYLTPKSAGGLVLATLFSSTLAPRAAPAGHVLLRSLLGGARNPTAVSRSDAELLAAVASESARPLGLRAAPVFTHVTRYEQAIPRFDLGHLERRAALARELPEGLAVLGNFTKGLDLETLVREAQELAARTG